MSSLPPSSDAFSETDESVDDRDAVRNVDEDDEDGEDLFGEEMSE